MSCHPAVTINGNQRILPEMHCRFLVRDPGAGHFACSVYENRHELAPWCLSVEQAAQDNALAHDCPYTEQLPDWKGKRWATPQERAIVLPALRRRILNEGLISYDSPDAAIRILNAPEAGGCETDRWEYELSGDGSHYRFRRIATA